MGKIKTTQALLDKIKTDRDNGFSIKQLAEKYNLSIASIYEYNRNGYELQQYKSCLRLNNLNRSNNQSKDNYQKALQIIKSKGYNSVVDFISQFGVQKYYQDIKTQL